MWFSPVDYEIGEEVDCFPYIGEDGRLRLWDTKKSKDIMRYSRNGPIVNGFLAEEVRERFPKLFELAQHEGFWRDIGTGKRTTTTKP